MPSLKDESAVPPPFTDEDVVKIFRRALTIRRPLSKLFLPSPVTVAVDEFCAALSVDHPLRAPYNTHRAELYRQVMEMVHAHEAMRPDDDILRADLR